LLATLAALYITAIAKESRKNLAIPVTFNKIRVGREIGNVTGKNGNGKVLFSRNGKKSGTGKINFSRNGNGKDHFPVPVYA